MKCQGCQTTNKSKAKKRDRKCYLSIEFSTHKVDEHIGNFMGNMVNIGGKLVLWC